MIACVPVTPTGEIDPRWGRAGRVAIADVRDGALERWQEVEVGWDVAHDMGPEGDHHARVARFLQEQGVQVVVAHHMGEPMRHMLDAMGLHVRLGVSGDARAAVLATAAEPALEPPRA
jgi:predicted Fe-Mo cluster-binding NifX family protein